MNVAGFKLCVRPDNQRGFVALAALAFILLGAALTLLLVEESGMALNTTVAQAERRTLDNVTEAAMAHAVWQLRQNTSCSNFSDLAWTPFAEHSYAASVTPNGGTPVTLAATGSLANGTTSYRTRTNIVTYGAPLTTVLQPGSEGKDTFIEGDGGHQDHNKADDKTIEVDSEDGKELRALIQFDLSSIPMGSRIASATLELDMSKSEGAADTIQTHRITASWTEDGVTWLSRNGSDDWSSPGGDFDPAASSSTTVDARGWVSFDLQALAQGWVNGTYPNHGFVLLAPSSPGGQKKEFTSSDFGSPIFRPKLTITYACECGVPCGAINESLLSHWKLDETSGNTAEDSIGDFDGALEGDPSWTTGKVDGALEFDGSGDLVDVGRLLPDGTPELTIAAWVYKRDGADSRVITKSSGTSRSDHVYSLGVSNRTIRIRLTTEDHNGNADFDGGTISLNQWTHVAFTYDGSNLRIYRNGSETEVHALTGDIVPSKLDTVIGNVNTDDSRFWNGLLDDVRLYDATLTAAEIADLAGRSPTELVAHWTLDDGSGSTATDATGNQDGTLQGGPAWTNSGLDGSLLFDGDNDYVDAGTFDVVGNGITMSGWMNVNRLRNDGRIISKATSINASDAWWQLSLSDGGADHYLRTRIKAGGSTTTVSATSIPLREGHWYFAASTYDNESGEIRLYLNGTEVTSRSHAAGGALDTDASVSAWVGGNGDPTKFFDGTLDDVRVHNGALTPGEMSDLEDSGADAHTPAYTEARASWQASRDGQWQAVDLSANGVPGKVVAEVAILNTSTNRERYGGVRATDSSIDRRLRIHEAESGGADAMTMHVQVDGDAEIEVYAEDSDDLEFELLGYWTAGTYVERFDNFTSDDDGSWEKYSMAGHGVPSGSVVDLGIVNLSSSRENLGGARRLGSSIERRLDLQEAEGGGGDMIGIAVQTSDDISSTIEVFSEDEDDIQFYVLGYWSVAPGRFDEALVLIADAPGSDDAWEPLSLDPFGVPGYSIAQVALANGDDGSEDELGARQFRSAQDRRIELHEAEGGGDDLATLHVKTDGDARIEWFDGDVSDDHRFYVLGWWFLSP